MGVEVNQRHPSLPDDVGDARGVGVGDRVVTAEHDRNRPGGGDRCHRLPDLPEGAFDIAAVDLDVTRIDDAEVA